MTSLFLTLLAAAPAFTPLGDGVEYAALKLEEKPRWGDGVLHVVRIDSERAMVDFGLATRDGARHTAKEWAERTGACVVINSGMYEPSGASTGRLVRGEHLNQPDWKKNYESVLLVGQGRAPGPSAMLVDRDLPGFEEQARRFHGLVQNLRLIRGEATPVWKPNGKQWSEALVATDAQGRILFLFSRTPYEMAALNTRLLALPLGIVRAMHVEGGPEASLSVHTPSLKLDLAGSYETGFREDDSNREQWALPNVLTVRCGAGRPDAGSGH